MHQDIGFHLLVFSRIASAIAFGFALGLERELTNKYAGLRTHILVCLGSCVFTILSIYAFPAAVYGSHGDPARISAQILTGIGFIGGGTVLRHGNSVYGLTTAATLWVAACIGMACGTGMLGVGLITTIISVGVLVLIRFFERDILSTGIKNTKQVKITASCSNEDATEIHNFILENFDRIHELSRRANSDDLTYIDAVIDVAGKNKIQSMYKSFEGLKGLKSILIQEDNE